MNFPRINNEVRTNKSGDLSFRYKRDNYKQGKFSNLQSIGIIVIKVKKQGWSPTPADILVGI